MKESYPFFVSHYYKLDDSLLIKFSLLIKKKKTSKTLSIFWILYRKLATYYCVQSLSFDSLWPQKLQRTRLACPSSSPRVCSNSCPFSWWCHPTVSSSVVPFSCLQSCPASGSFPMCQLFISGGHSIGFQLQHQSFQWIFRTYFFMIDLFDLLALQGTLKSLFQHHSSKASVIWCSAFFIVQLSHPYMTTGKTIALTVWTFVVIVMPLLFNTLCRFVIAFLLRSKCLSVS